MDKDMARSLGVAVGCLVRNDQGGRAGDHTHREHGRAWGPDRSGRLRVYPLTRLCEMGYACMLLLRTHAVTMYGVHV
jgi:hypothetical protein